MPRDDSPFESGRYRYSRLDAREDEESGNSDSVPKGDERPGSRRAGPLDRVIGVLLGLILGVAIVVAFVFLGGGEAIDPPGLEGAEPAREAPQRPGGGPEGVEGAGR